MATTVPMPIVHNRQELIHEYEALERWFAPQVRIDLLLVGLTYRHAA